MITIPMEVYAEEIIKASKESTRLMKKNMEGRATLRDQFAMAALTGLLSRENTSTSPVIIAYDYADEMLRARGDV